jgi:hypothetical protein
MPPRTTIVGVRFLPGTAPPLPVMLDELVDQRIPLADLWRTGRSPRQCQMGASERTGRPEHAVTVLEEILLPEFRAAQHVDRSMCEASRCPCRGARSKSVRSP